MQKKKINVKKSYKSNKKREKGQLTTISATKKLKKALQKEIERLNIITDITDNLGTGLVIISRDYRTIWANNVTRQVYGDVDGKICYKTYYQREEICPGCGVRKIFENGKDKAVHEQKGKDINGNTIWSRIISSPIKDKKGNIIAALELKIPITDLKRIEEELKETANILKLNESRLKTLIELNKMRDASLHEITEFAFEEAIRLTQSEIGFIGFMNEDETVLTIHSWSKKTLPECLIKDKPIDFSIENAGLWAEAIRQRKTIVINDYSAPNPLKRGYPEGHINIIRCMVIPVFDGEHIVAVAGVGNKESDYNDSDVHQLTLLMEGMWKIIQQKQVDEKLQKSEARLAEAQRIANIGSWDWDIEKNELYWTDETYRVFGLTPQKFKPSYEAFLNSVHPKDRELVKKAVNDALYNRKPYKIDHYIILPSGEEKIVHEQAKVIFDKSGKPVRMIGTAQDITELKQTEKKLQRQLLRISALRNIDMAIISSLDLRITLKIFLDEITIHLGVDAADILLFNSKTKTLEYASGRGFRTDALHYTRLRLGEGYAGRSALKQKIINIPDLSEAEDGLKRSKFLKDEGFISYFAVPLITKGHIKGVLELFHRNRLEPNSDWFEFLELFSNQAAIAIDNATLFNDLHRSNIELSLAYDATLEGWSRALDFRDKETEGHSQRVTDYTLKIARIMGMSDEELVHVRRGALLHDIGKLGVPDSILFKPDKLNDEEWKIMKMHPKIAYDILSPIEYLKRALDIPYCHHEKWDGTGYPRGLKGEDIPLSARIFALVDVYDALGSDRPYRPAWSKEKIMEYINEESGKHFDPKVVNAFLNVITEM